MRTAGSFALDTNIVIAIMGGDRSASSNAAMAHGIFIPAPVAGELFYGAFKSARPLGNLRHLNEYLAVVLTLPCDIRVAEQYGALRERLRKKGSPIPENDMWIAAVALANDLPLVTRDRHVSEVEGLAVVRW